MNSLPFFSNKFLQMPTALTSAPIHPNLMLEGINVTVMNPAEIPEPKKRSSKNEMANLFYKSNTS
jgi:hypothetical protein